MPPVDERFFKEDGEHLRAVVIARPPAIAYDQLVINKGTADGVAEGQEVLVSDDISIGVAGETFQETSRVILYSAYGREQNVFLEKTGVAAIAVGRGNGELAIVLPRDLSVFVGEKIITLAARPRVIGFVEKVEAPPNSPTQTLQIKQPFNIYNIYHVGVVR